MGSRNVGQQLAETIEVTTVDQRLGCWAGARLRVGVGGEGRGHLTLPLSSPRGSPPTGSVLQGLHPGSCGSAPRAPLDQLPPSRRALGRQVAESLGPGVPGVQAGQGRQSPPLPRRLPSSWPGIPKGLLVRPRTSKGSWTPPLFPASDPQGRGDGGSAGAT